MFLFLQLVDSCFEFWVRVPLDWIGLLFLIIRLSIYERD